MSSKLIKVSQQNSNDIVIDDGSRVYNIKNKRGEILGKFTFIPSDVDGLMERYDHAVSVFREIENSIDKDSDKKALLEAKEKLMNAVDELFNADVSGSFFSITGPLTPLDSGELYVVNIIKAVQAVIEKETGRRLQKVDRASKYTQKYHK